jgi:Tfp pilus assembly protein PilV
MSRSYNQKPGFSLIEVLFSVLFLVMVGLAMSAVNAAAIRLVSAAELKVAAYGLSDEAVGYIALQKKTLSAANFTTLVTNAGCLASGCYVYCPTDITQACSLSSTIKTVKLGQNSLQFSRRMTMATISANQYLVTMTTSWGAGRSKQIVVGEIIN